MTYFKPLFPIIFFFMLSGCTQQASNLADTYSLLYKGFPDASYSNEEIQMLPYASMYARLGDGPRGFLVLAYAEPYAHNQTSLKWMSADNEVIETASGRVIKTLKLPGTNLAKLDSDTPDPLSLGLLNPSTPKTWQFRIDFMPGYHFGYPATSVFENKGNAKVAINGVARPAVYTEETVSISSLDKTYTNQYWLDPSSGKVLKTVQHPAPNMDAISVTFLKAYQGAQ
ncbi:YjbF family lipoprotein [Salinivibrio kushneri]|uniref:YjbF family lipoprotein n=1 Tax=Salinivibrio kushneri TaxID=1908198 RepID=UPI0009895158|nr:YjbF family lipoprotein [Salinivibrio kushneri]OOE49386.1 hypothetical protein BZG11_12055 [Salinivibrio kushneri]OOE52130.1 hypothetical protein BZG10_06645 [Salinivibrio kushneri]